MNKLLYILLVCLVSLQSCAKKENQTFVLNPSIKNNATAIYGDTIEYNTLVMAEEYYIMDDTVLLVFNDTRHSDFFFEFYNLNSGELIKRFLNRGNGHRELVDVIAYYNDGFLFVNGFMNKTFVTVDCRRLLNDSLYEPTFAEYSVYSQNLIPVDDNLFIYENAYCFSEPSINVTQDAPRLLFSNDEADGNRYKYDTFNVTGGIIMRNKNLDRVIYASKRFPYIEIYNSKLELIRRISGPDELDVKYFINEKNNEIIFKGVIPNTFVRSTYNADHLYFVYKGKLSNDLDHDTDTWIFKFDWEGRILDSYFYNGSIECLSVSNKEDFLYVTTYDSLGIPALVKLRLPQQSPKHKPLKDED